MEHQTSRRDLLLTSLMAALPLGVVGAAASPLNTEQMTIKPPDTRHRHLRHRFGQLCAQRSFEARLARGVSPVA
jgi:hypothetical protein